jgi:hypothetical protein
MSEHQHWIVNSGDYQTQVFYTDDAADPDAQHPTEWVLLRISDGEQVAGGWGSTPREARDRAAAAMAESQQGRRAA